MYSRINIKADMPARYTQGEEKWVRPPYERAEPANPSGTAGTKLPRASCAGTKTSAAIFPILKFNLPLIGAGRGYPGKSGTAAVAGNHFLRVGLFAIPPA